MNRIHHVPADFLRGFVAQMDPASAFVPLRDASGAIVDFRYVEVNDLACQFLGRSRAELLTGTLTEHFPEHRTSGVLRAFISVMESRKPLAIDDGEVMSVARPESARFDIRVTEVDGVLLVSWRDNTERAATARVVAEAHETFRLLAEHASDAVLLADPDGTVRWMSAHGSMTFGWSDEDVIGRNVLDFVHPDDRAQNLELLAQVIAGSPTQIRGRVRTKNGGHRVVLSTITPIKGESGDVIRVVAGWKDIHDELLAASGHDHETRRLATVVASSPDGLVRGDNEGRLVWVSEAACSMSGWDSSTLTGLAFIDLIHDEDRVPVMQAQRSLQRGGEVQFEARLRTAVAGLRWISFRVRPELDDTGTVIGRIASWRDVHAERTATNALARSAQLYKAAIEDAPMATAVLDLDGRVVAVSRALCRLTERLPGWLCEHHIGDIIHPDDVRDDLITRTELLAKIASCSSSERRIVCGDGRAEWVRQMVSVTRDVSGRPMGYVCQFVGINREVFERHQPRLVN